MPRLLPALALTALALAAASCGGGDGGAKQEPEAVDPAKPASSTPAAPAAGFVTEKGADWSFSRPDGWQEVSEAEAGEGKESVIYQSPPGTSGVPSQVGIGTASQYKNPLTTAVRVAKDIDTARFPDYDVAEEGPLEVPGAEGYKIDATYPSFTDEPVPVRIVNVYVQTPGKRQMNFFVRGPEADLQELGLDQLVDSFRVLGGTTSSS